MKIRYFEFEGFHAVNVTDCTVSTTHVSVSDNVIVSHNDLYGVFVSVFFPEVPKIIFLPLYDMSLNEAVRNTSMWEQNGTMELFLKVYWNEEYLLYEQGELFAEGFEPFVFFQ